MLPPIDESKCIELACWNNYVRAPYLQGESSRTKMLTRFAPSVGTWRMDHIRGLYGREITVIGELDPHQLIDSELEKRQDAKRYEQWIREGNRPPPIEVVETDKGQLKVSDGHRRLVASRNAGVPILCWVSPAVNMPTGDLDYNSLPIKTGLTFEKWVAHGVAAL